VRDLHGQTDIDLSNTIVVPADKSYLAEVAVDVARNDEEFQILLQSRLECTGGSLVAADLVEAAAQTEDAGLSPR